MALNDTFHAHCPVCGNLELQHISPEHVRGALSLVWRLLGVPALRCEPCRYKYFSVLPLRQTEPEEEPVRASSAD
jgi:C4-type Zn-finger protein